MDGPRRLKVGDGQPEIAFLFGIEGAYVVATR